MQPDGNQTVIKAVSGWPKACYGIDLHGAEPVVVLAEKKHGKVVWQVAQVNNTTLAKAVDTGTVTSACLSARDSLTRRLEAPFSSRKKVLRVLPTLLDIQLPFSIEDCQYEFFDYKKTDAGTMEALAVAATKDNIKTKIDTVKKVGFDPEIIDVEGLVVWSQILRETGGAISGRKNDSDEAIAIKVVLVLEGEHSSLTIGRGEHFLNSYGLRDNDVKRVLRLVKAHLANDKDIPEWFLAGSGAENSELVTFWKNELSANLYNSVNVIDEPLSFIARGLAIRALSAGELHCNLRSGEELHTRVAAHSIGVQFKFALLCFLAGLLLCVGSLVIRHAVVSRQKEINIEFKKVVDSLAGYHVTAMGKDAVSIVNNSVIKRKSDLAPFLRAFEPSLLAVFIDLVGVAEKTKLNYENIILDYENVVISGSALNFDDSRELVTVLTEHGYSVCNKRGSKLNGGRVQFIIKDSQL